MMMVMLTASSCFTLVMASWGARPSLKFIMSRGPLWYLGVIISIASTIVIVVATFFTNPTEKLTCPT